MLSLAVEQEVIVKSLLDNGADEAEQYWLIVTPSRLSDSCKLGAGAMRVCIIGQYISVGDL